MRAPHLSLAGLRRFVSLLAVIAAAWLFSVVPAAADNSQEEPAVKPTAGGDEPAVVTQASVPPEDTSRKNVVADEAEPQKAEGAAKRRKPSKPRRGGNPCMTPDPGFGIYDTWSSAPSVGQMIAPHKGGVTKSGGFDLVVHFHGHEAIRKEFVKTAKGIVLVGIDLGIGSGAYSKAFASPYVFTQLIRSVEAEMAKRSGKKNAHVRKLALSAWSAGYGAIEQILRQPAGKDVDALILLDSLHTGYADEQQGTLKVDQLEPFVEFAKRAAAKRTFMYMSHSSIIPPGYASTGEVAAYVVKQLKGKAKKASRQDVLGLDMFERFDRGNFHMRGYTGNDKPDHCAHIGLMADIVRVHLQGAWKTPKGKR